MGRADKWTPQAIAAEFTSRNLTDESKAELMDRATSAIRRAETWEAVAGAMFRLMKSAGKAAGGFG